MWSSLEKEDMFLFDVIPELFRKDMRKTGMETASQTLLTLERESKDLQEQDQSCRFTEIQRRTNK